MKSQAKIALAFVFWDSCIECLPVPQPTSIITSSGEKSILDNNHSSSTESVRADTSSPYLHGSCPSTFDDLDSKILKISSSEIIIPPQNLKCESFTWDGSW